MTEPARAEEALRRSEERLRVALEAGRMGTWEWDIAGGTVTWSPSLETIHGWRSGTFPGTLDAVLREVHPDDRERLQTAIQRAVEEAAHYRIEYRIVRPDGRVAWLGAYGQIIRDAAGTALRMVGVCGDISERKAAEEERAALLARSEDARAAAEAAERRAFFLVRASDLLTSTLNIEHTLHRLVHLAVEDLADWAAVDIVEDDGAILRVAVAHRDAGREVMMRSMRERCRLDPEAPFGVPHVLRRGTPALYAGLPEGWFEQSTHSEADRRALEAMGFTSALVVPLVTRGRAIGAITLLSGAGRRYGPEDQATAEELARRAALAVDNALLYEEAERRRREAEALAEVGQLLSRSLEFEEVSQKIVETLLALLHARAAGLHLEAATGDVRTIAVAGAADTWGLNRVYPRGTGLLGLALARGGTVTTLDFSGDARIEYPPEIRARLERADYRALLAVPFAVASGERGVLVVGDRAGRRFGPADVRLAEAFATQAAIALENARLYQEAAAANRAKDEFLATLSHELRTPLQSMLGWTRLLRVGALDAAARERAMEAIERNTRAQTQLIEDLLDVSRIVAGQMRIEIRPVNLLVVIGAALESIGAVAGAKGVELRTRLDPAAAEVAGDPDRLQQVLWNLLSNAVKFTSRGGLVEVSLERAGPRARLCVADTGRGIAADVLPYVFDRFRQADSSTTRTHGGLGLGLAIVRHLVELHGGTVTASSDGVDAGAAFTVELPLSEPVSPLPSAPSPDVKVDPVRLDGVRVLVVDDSEETLDLLVTVLGRYGAAVTTARDADGAIAALDRLDIDVLVCDISMPGKDGLALIGEMGRQRMVPALALTAHARSEDRAQALAAGFQRYFAKPVDPLELVRVLGVLAGRGPTR